MIPPELDAAMRGAMAAHQAGRLDDAEATYRRVVQRLPGFPDAHHLLGLVRYQRRDYATAESEIRRAIAGSPGVAMFWFNLGNVLRDAGKRSAAIDAFRRAVDLQPTLPGALANLANLLRESERYREAMPIYERCLALFPHDAIAWNGAGCCQRSLGRPDLAERCLRRAVELNPRARAARINLAKLLAGGAGKDEARAIAQALAGEAADHIDELRELGNVFGRLRDSTDAEACFREVLRRDPGDARARLELAGVLLDGWRHDDAWTELEAWFATPGKDPVCLQGALMRLLYFDRLDPVEVLERHRRYDALLAERRGAESPQPAAGPAGRRIRVGFASPDFRRHSCAHFVWPLLSAVDRSRFELFAYSNVAQPDAITARFRESFEHWREIVGATPDEARALVRADGLDVLIDLAGHTNDNVLPIFSPRVAPVQAAWLGYPATSGLSTIDYRFTDAVADPVEEAGGHCSERLLRLPDGFLCYSSLDDPAPASANDAAIGRDPQGGVTFGSFNNLAKLTPDVLALWAEIVRAVPGARLVLKAIQLGDATARGRVLDHLATHGVARDRVALHAWLPGGSHLASYDAIDVALDPFPYNGATTTCEALYMGVPVVALRGKAHVGRVGASILTALGRPELIADSRDEYRAIAVRLGTDRAWRTALAGDLAGCFRASPLHDAARFARKFEQAVEDMAGAVELPEDSPRSS